LLLQASLTSEYRRDPAVGIKLIDEHEQLCGELGSEANLANGLLVKANLLFQQNDQAGSLAELQEAEAILRKLGDKSGLATCLGAKTLRYEASGRPIEAIQALKEAEGLYRELDKFEALARAIFDQARLYALMMSMPAAALPGMRQAQELAEAHGLSSLAQQIKQVADGISARTN
jgi:tetratricopeptide (TPR) repeat protein